jgi:hypothetical protein
MKIGKLEKIDLRHIWKNEATDFTVWIEDNIDHLSDFLGFDLEVLEREKKVGSFSIDLLAQTSNGDKVIIENQLEKTDHTHLGQIITYFTNLDAKCVIWIAREIRQEHANAINWLNEFTGIAFYLIQVEAYKIGQSDPAPYFKLVCKPDEEMKAIGTEIKDLSDRGKFNIQFWETMMEKCKGRLDHFCNKKASKYHFHTGGAGKGGFSFNFIASKKGSGIELYIDSGDEDKNLAYLKELELSKNEIEKEFGKSLSWEELSEKRACRIRFTICSDSITECDVAKAQDQMISWMEKFESVIRPRLKNLKGQITKAAS